MPNWSYRWLWMAALVGMACSGAGGPDASGAPAPRTQPPTPSPTLDIEGIWELRRDPPSPGTLRLALAVDSVSGSRFRARVTFLMVGNVGLDADQYLPGWGEISHDGGVRLDMVRRGLDATPNRIVAGGTGDSIAIERLEWEGTVWTTERVRWWLVRESAR